MCTRRRSPFLCLAKERNQRKATPPAVSLRCAAGNLRCSRLGRRCGTRFVRCAHAARTAAASQSTKRGHAALPAPAPRPVLLGTGSGALKSSRPSLRSAGWLGRAKRRPEWFPHPCGCAEERSGRGARVRRRTHTPRALTRGRCLSGARKRAASLAAHPAREHRRLPLRAAKGTRPVGSPFLCLLSFGEAKESRSPAGARPGQRKHPTPRTPHPPPPFKPGAGSPFKPGAGTPPRRGEGARRSLHAPCRRSTTIITIAKGRYSTRT